MTRQRLPDRRPNETFDLEFDGTGYAVTIGFFSDGRGRASVIGAILAASGKSDNRALSCRETRGARDGAQHSG